MTSTVQYPHIAFVGKAGAGKSTCADYLVEHHGYQRLSFAAPLRSVAVSLWGEEARNDRSKLQALGLAVRNIEPDTWCKLLVATIHNATELEARWDRQLDRTTPVRFVVDDCRFPNEVTALRGAGFTFVYVAAPRDQRVLRLRANHKLQDESQVEHESETALDAYTFEHRIVNDDWRETLEANIRAILNKEIR